jgi:broad specificity phosphatase PhoE
MSSEAKIGRLLLVRHTAVAASWRTRCYGATDVPLSLEGRSEARALASELSDWRPDLIVSSPLRRARVLAARTARKAGAPLTIDARLSERNFGSWEGRQWDEIHAETGDAMMGMLTAPDRFRPGGGETTNELSERVLFWRHSLPPALDVLAVCHGGPIAALVGTAQGLAPSDWAKVIPAPGESTDLSVFVINDR